MSALVTEVIVQKDEVVDPLVIASARDAAHLQAVLPVIKAELATMERQLDKRMANKVAQGSMTEDEAKMAWMEKATYLNIINRIEKRIRASGLNL